MEHIPIQVLGLPYGLFTALVVLWSLLAVGFVLFCLFNRLAKVTPATFAWMAAAAVTVAATGLVGIVSHGVGANDTRTVRAEAVADIYGIEMTAADMLDLEWPASPPATPTTFGSLAVDSFADGEFRTETFRLAWTGDEFVLLHAGADDPWLELPRLTDTESSTR